VLNDVIGDTDIELGIFKTAPWGKDDGWGIMIGYTW